MPHLQVYRAVETVLHPEYGGNIRGGFDIALLKLPTPTNIQPCRLVSAGRAFNEGTQFTALGWGSTDASFAVTPSLKQAPNLVFVSLQTCNAAYNGELNTGHLCAGTTADVQNTCVGDSGGPLLIADRPQNQLSLGKMRFDVVAGVTAFGVRPCTNISVPAVYTNVAQHREWIESVISREVSARQAPECV